MVVAVPVVTRSRRPGQSRPYELPARTLRPAPLLGDAGDDQQAGPADVVGVAVVDVSVGIEVDPWLGRRAVTDGDHQRLRANPQHQRERRAEALDVRDQLAGDEGGVVDQLRNTPVFELDREPMPRERNGTGVRAEPERVEVRTCQRRRHVGLLAVDFHRVSAKNGDRALICRRFPRTSVTAGNRGGCHVTGRALPDPNSSLWAWIAHDLRLYRMRAGMRQEDVGRVIGCVKGTVSRLESGDLQLDEKRAEALDGHWNTYGHFARLLLFAHSSNHPDWRRQHTCHEARADVIKAYEALLVPGLFQTPAYARALFACGDVEDVEAALAERMARQEILARPRPPRLWVLLDEGVIARPCGGPGVMREQLQRLLDEGEKPYVSFRVVPGSAGLHVGVDGSFEILYSDRQDVAFAEAQLRGRLVIPDAEVRTLEIRYDQIGAHALPETLSRDLIRQHMEDMP